VLSGGWSDVTTAAPTFPEVESSIAGPGQRVLAYSIDYLVILLIEAGLFELLPSNTPLLRKLLAWTPPRLDDAASLQHAAVTLQDALMPVLALLVVAQLVLEIAYFMTAERLSGGRSIGKGLVGLRVVGADGSALSGRASLVRSLLRLIDVLPTSYLIGFVMMIASRRRQRLGDFAAGTVVVRRARPTPGSAAAR
jgi:uncharacterized RDD family membrane protein YckC